MNKTIFIVDDSDVNLSVAERGLENYYNVITIPSGQGLFRMLEKLIPDLIVLDILMPQMDGFQVLERLKAIDEYKDIPIIFLTGVSNERTEIQGFQMGAVDFIHKPFSIPVLLNRINLHLNVAGVIKDRTKALENAHRSLLFVLSDIIESRDKGTGGHVFRTTQYVLALIKAMRRQGVYAEEMEDWDIHDVAHCAALHDVGKITIADSILNKPGKLSIEEFTEMKNHASSGAHIIDRIINRTGEDKFLRDSRIFAEYHHENWDGTGYPHGLKGEEIPLLGRILAIADVYDALVTARSYKKPFTDEEATKIMMEEKGKKFDPRIADVFYSIREKFVEIHQQA